MTYEKFLEAIKGEDTAPVTKMAFLKRTKGYDPNSYRYRGKNAEEKPDNTELYCIYDTAHVGGMSGGNCYDDTPSSAYIHPEGYTEVRKNFDEEFDTIIQKLVPNITFLKYKALYNDVVETDGYTEPEYYGNSTEHVILYVELKKFYKKMKEMELI